MSDTFREMLIRVEWDDAMLSQDMRRAIENAMRRAAREIVAKAALIANPEVLTVQTSEWDPRAGDFKPMNLEVTP